MIKTGIKTKCIVCGMEFLVKPSRYETAKYCTRKCMGIANRRKIKTQCSYCGKEIEVEPNRIKEKNYCNNECKFNDRQKGCGITTDGYVWIYIKGYNKVNQVKLHRYLMEIKLGRKLLSEEIVHHKDFNKLNNSIDNLEVLTKVEHNKIHRHLNEENRKDCFSKEEIKMIENGCSYIEFNNIFPERTSNSFYQKKHRLK